jgi:hypothetical protein
MILICSLDKVRCSVVIDSYSQKGVHVSDYCPKMEHCAEGTHVMCMYYDPVSDLLVVQIHIAHLI